MKKIKISIIITILLITLCYVTSITNIPDSIILFEGEKLSLKSSLGIEINQNNNYQAAQVSTNLNEPLQVGKTDMKVSLFGLIPVKEVSVNVIPTTTVIPSGNNIGVKLYTSGVLVVGMSEISGEDNKTYKPYENTGIKEGDLIVGINNTIVSNTSELISSVTKYGGSKINVKYTRNGNTFETSMLPIKGSDEQYKLGLWVRDGSAGIGTVSFYEPSTGMFAALRSWNNRY